MKRSNDPFEQYQRQYEANVKRMKRLGNLNSERTSSSSLVRRPLGALPTTTNTTRNTPSQVKSMLSSLHHTSKREKDRQTLPVSKVLEMYDKNSFVPLQRSGQNLKFFEINKEFASVLRGQLSFAAANVFHLKNYIDWLKKTRYNFVRPLERRKEDVHTVVNCRYIGKFLQSARVEMNGVESIVFLFRTDKRFEIGPGDRVQLGKSSAVHMMGSTKIPVYSKWQVFKDKVSDVNLFR